MDDARSAAVEGVERGRVSAHELSWSLRAVNLASTEVDQALAAKVGLRALDYTAMGHIMSSEHHPVGPVELGQRLGISAGSATELVDRLERAGHVSRERGADDRRRVRVVPRPDAVGRILGELGPLFERLDDLAGHFDEREQQAISRYLRAAAERLADYAEALERGDPSAASDTR